jgi:S1-C subfamily serine protease
MNAILRGLQITVLWAACFVSAVFGEEEKQICPPLQNVHWNNHIGVIKLAPNKTGMWRTIGSGFVFGPNKDVVTCAHVFIDALSLGETNLFYSAQSFKMPRALKFKYFLPRFDLAVFTMSPTVEGEPMVVGDFKKMRPGDKIYYYGLDTRYGSKDIPAARMNEGSISAIGSALNEGVTIDFLEFEGVGIPGYSGGPVFNKNGELVAVMREAWTKKGIKGGGEILINRAFSLEILSVLDSQVFGGTIVPMPPPPSKSRMNLLDILEIPKPEIKSNSSPAK